MAEIQFHYRARKRSGAPVTGTILAPSAREAKLLLTQQDLIPLELSQRKPGLAAGDWSQWLGGARKTLTRVSLEELLIFNQQLQIAYSVGIPVGLAMQMIAGQTKNPRLHEALSGISADLEKGRFLGDSMSKHPAIFDELYVTLVKAGEASGQLDSFLQRISFLLERRAETRAKVKGALFYPKIVVFFMVAATFFFVYVLIPKIKEFLGRYGKELPPLTKFVIACSDFAVGYWYILAFLFLAGGAAYRQLVRTAQGREFRDRLLLKLPVVGGLLFEIELNAFCFITEMLVKSGISITETLKIVRESLSNRVVANEVAWAEKEIQRGGTMSSGLKKSPVFPEVFVNLVSVGEESGRLDSVLGKVGDYYRRNIDYKLANLSKLIEPILLFIIFIGVGILALAIMLPIWKMTRAVRG